MGRLKLLLLVCGMVLGSIELLAQQLNAGMPILEEHIRRQQLLGKLTSPYSFYLRPISWSQVDQEILDGISVDPEISKKSFELVPLPVVLSGVFNSKRPYGWGNRGLLPNVGFQTYFSTGFYARAKFLTIQFQPEFIYAQNKSFQGFGEGMPLSAVRARFFYWNNGDHPERFGVDPISRFWWGQSSIKLEAGPFALGLSTENIWWGPGQFNSLIFSNNAEGFPHLKLETRRPAKTFLGTFEGQVILGRLENSLLPPSQNLDWNQRYFRKFNGDWRYLNGIHLAYQPSFLKGFTVGFSRTFQQYNRLRGNKFEDWFPIFEVFQKETFFQNGNTVIYDSKGQDQQVAISFRFFSTKGKFEVYSEFGRRDHNFNWREFLLNPEHARAYLMGFSKLIPLSEEKFLSIKGEVTHQQESVNRYIRYLGLTGNQTWHTHSLARGFVNRGESLGVGQGVGSNVQTMEVSMVDGIKKRGIVLERLANHQDFFYRAFGQNSDQRPWIDYSLGLLWDKQFNSFLIGTKVQLIQSQNYQWQEGRFSSEDFDNAPRSLALFAQVHLIYALSKN